MSKARMGILGGTFDPVHLGHLIVAEYVREKLQLAEVLFIPAGQPWLKQKEGETISPAEHRLAMVKLAVASNPHFKASSIEIERPGRSYSIDTILEMKAVLGHEVELYFFVGPDALAELPQWKEPARLLESCQVMGMNRSGYARPDLHRLEKYVPGAFKRIMLIDVPQIDISASEIRSRVARALSIRYLVPELVEQYIIKHKLYL